MKNLIDEIKKLQIENRKLKAKFKKISEIVNGGKQNVSLPGSSVSDTLKIQNSGIVEDISKQ